MKPVQQFKILGFSPSAVDGRPFATAISDRSFGAFGNNFCRYNHALASMMETVIIAAVGLRLWLGQGTTQ
jgi:hypothetical protein